MKRLFLGLAIMGGQFVFAQKVVDLKVENNQAKEQPAVISKEKVNIYSDNFFYFFVCSILISFPPECKTKCLFLSRKKLSRNFTI